MQSNQAVEKMPFKEFAIDWRRKAKITSNEAARNFNKNPSSEKLGDETGDANREMILFRANRIAKQNGLKRPFVAGDASKRFEDFSEAQRELIIYALNEIGSFGRALPPFISIADCRLNL